MCKINNYSNLDMIILHSLYYLKQHRTIFEINRFIKFVKSQNDHFQIITTCNKIISARKLPKIYKASIILKQKCSELYCTKPTRSNATTFNANIILTMGNRFNKKKISQIFSTRNKQIRNNKYLIINVNKTIEKCKKQ